MNRILSIILAAVLTMPIWAQEEGDYNQQPSTSSSRSTVADKDCDIDYSCWLPKAGEWHLQVGMNPLAITMGGEWSEVGGFAFGYMLTDMIELKATCGLDIEVWNNRGYALDDAARAQNSLSMAKVTDRRTDKRMGGSVSLGADFHIGSQHKVQGVFGVGLVYGFRVEKQEFSYGNAITEFNQVPSVTGDVDRNNDPIIPAYESPDGSDILNARLLNRYNDAADPMRMIGLYGSAGIEWFVTRKLAIGLNATLNIRYQFMNAYTTEYEGWSHQQSKLVTWTESERPTQNGFALRTSNLVGLNLFMSVYL